MEPAFKFEIYKDRMGDNISFYGQIDSHTESHFAELVGRVSGKKVNMDFSNTVRINSMGIAILLRSIKKIKEDKKSEVAVFGENKANALLFRITGMYMLTGQHTQDVVK
jgi:anti-anti-sigma regulatory factor